MDTSKVLLYSLTALVFRIAFGFISKACNMGKGYKGGFAFGFFLCVFGVIAVALRPSAREQMDYINRLTGTRQFTWLCKYCNTMNDITNNYCIGCGKIKPNYWICINCGETNNSKAKFCTSCGKRKEEN